MEGEPVSRHIGEMQVEKPTFGIFIADSLNETVINHFYTLSHQKSKIYNGYYNEAWRIRKWFIKNLKSLSVRYLF